MPPIHHRDPGVVGMLGHPTRRPYFGIIVDGLHSHPNTVRMAYGACKEGCVLVSDGEYYSITPPAERCMDLLLIPETHIFSAKYHGPLAARWSY